MTELPDLTPGDWAVLTVIAERPNRGYGIAQLLAPDGEFGRVWTMSRQLFYYLIEKLQQLGLVEVSRTEERRSRTHRILVVTESGTCLLEGWLDEPVKHVLDIRSVRMLKLLIHHRAASTDVELLGAQSRLITSQIARLRRHHGEARGFERTLLQWRIHVAEATERFLDTSLRERSTWPEAG